MRYMLLICADETLELTSQEQAAMESDAEAWVADLDSRGIRQQGEPLLPRRDGAILRVRDGEVVLGDGPFAETKEQIAGFDILECASLEEAVEAASRHPVARIGTVEVRPFWQE